METELFQIINSFYGWGDPHDGIWFIGLEEASSWTKNNTNDIYQIRGKTHVYETKWNWKEIGSLGRGVRDYTSKIVQPLSVGYRSSSWREYRDTQLWKDGSKVFQANLYPLGKPSIRDWPDEYSELFGFEKRQYLEKVRHSRFPALYDFWRSCRPHTTICFGIVGWDDFIRLLKLDRDQAKQLASDVILFEKERIFLTPFLGQGFSNGRAENIVNQLRTWSIQLP